MVQSNTPPAVLGRFARSRPLANYSTWTVLALAGIAATQIALFAFHRNAADWVAHSRLVRDVSRETQRLAAERRSAVDGFVITRDSSFLEPESRAREALPRALDSLVTLTADNPGQQRRARALAAALAQWDSAYALPALLTLRPSPALKLSGAPLFAIVGERFAEFSTAEDVLFDQRAARDSTLTAAAALAAIIPLALLAGVIVAMSGRIRAKEAALAEQQHELEEQAIELENQVEELETSNRELTESGAELESARALAEQALAERDRVESLLDSALTSSPIGFAFLSRDLYYVAVNEQLAAARDLKPQDFVGRSVMEMASTPAAGGRALANLQHVIETGNPVLNNEMIGKSRTGAELRYTITYFPIRNSARELTGVGMVVTDTTERSRLEEQFRQSQKMEALGRLASGVAHDFRNLLTVIRSYVDLVLLETAESDHRRRELTEIRNAADRAAVLARQLLSFGRPQPLISAELDVNDSIAGVEAMLRHIAPASVVVESHCDKALGRVLADPGHVEQVLMNLAINAIDAMPKGGRMTFASANATLDESYSRNHPGVAPGQYVLLSVTDTGVGMDQPTLARMYEPFFTTKPAGKGTGLGLATVYGIVTQNGGHVHVDSMIGRGTTFKIYFPRLVTSEMEVPSELRAKPEPKRSARTETVLVVEDDAAVRGSLARILQKFGYVVLQAEHGADGIRVARSHEGPIHLAISDLMMPEMSGREFAERLDEVRPDTHVLFMSGFTDDEVLQRGLVGLNQAFIQKPFAIEEITSKVHEVLRESAGA